LKIWEKAKLVVERWKEESMRRSLGDWEPRRERSGLRGDWEKVS